MVGQQSYGDGCALPSSGPMSSDMSEMCPHLGSNHIDVIRLLDGAWIQEWPQPQLPHFSFHWVNFSLALYPQKP